MIKRFFNNKGFSLIELIVVVAIMAIGSAILIPSFINMSQESKTKQDEIKFQSICTALKSSLSDPEVQKEIEEWCNNEAFTVIFASDPQTGRIDLLKAQLIKEDPEILGVPPKILGGTKFGACTWQWTDREYFLQNTEAYGYQLVIKCTPKTYKTTAQAEIISWELPPEE